MTEIVLFGILSLYSKSNVFLSLQHIRLRAACRFWATGRHFFMPLVQINKDVSVKLCIMSYPPILAFVLDALMNRLIEAVLLSNHSISYILVEK